MKYIDTYSYFEPVYDICPMFDILLAFITAFALTYIATPHIIKIAIEKGLMDEPGERRSHVVKTPSLGGIGIFAGMLFSIIMWTPFNYFGPLQYILCAFIIIFLIGAKDDLDPLSPTKKFLGEGLAAFILVFKADVKLTSLYGIFGVYDLHPAVSIVLSIFTILLLINAFNLIDGINGLSASTGIMISIIFGAWFYQVHRLEIAIVAFSLAGATTAFLRYNVTPAKIFMGDTGSLLIGLVCSILAIQFIELHKEMGDSPYRFEAAPSFAIAALILPLFDTLRVFTIRALKGQSPFSPDRSHIHHMMIDTGLSHMQATALLVVGNLVIIAMAFLLQSLGNLVVILIVFLLALVFTGALSMISKRRIEAKAKQ